MCGNASRAGRGGKIRGVELLWRTVDVTVWVERPSAIVIQGRAKEMVSYGP